MTFRIAVVQPITHRPPGDRQWQWPELYDTFHPRPLRAAAE